MKEKQIEEMACKNCIHYEVCMYVNAQAVECARAENCKLFRDTAGYRKQSKWISVEDRLPKTGESVLVCDECGDVYTDRIEVDGDWSKEISRIHGIKYLYWMPLPDAPKKGERDV